jgi:hypothetical protein
MSYRGTYHFVQGSAVQTPAHAERLRSFLDHLKAFYAADQPGLPKPPHLFDSLFAIPLRPRSSFRWMTLYYWITWVFGLIALVAIVSLARFTNRALPIKDSEIKFFTVCWCGFVLFVPTFILYRWCRHPSARQKAIRDVAREQLGPGSDPADWFPSLALAVLLSMGVNKGAIPHDVSREAEKSLGSGNAGLALLVARMGIALGYEDRRGIERNEEITDECLRRIRN